MIPSNPEPGRLYLEKPRRKETRLTRAIDRACFIIVFLLPASCHPEKDSPLMEAAIRAWFGPRPTVKELGIPPVRINTGVDAIEFYELLDCFLRTLRASVSAVHSIDSFALASQRAAASMHEYRIAAVREINSIKLEGEGR